MKKKVGLVCCSNGQKLSYMEDISATEDILRNCGLDVVYSPYIYEKDSCFSGSGYDRARALMDMYLDEDIEFIFDISGGDIANEILPYLDFDIIKKFNKPFWGYSDLTTVINAIYTKTGNSSVLFQIKNIVWDETGKQRKFFEGFVSKWTMDTSLETLINDADSQLFHFSYEFIQGGRLEGTVIGGNIRCFLKLAGTEYFPDVTDKVLLLESLGGEVPQMVTYLNQLKQIGVFNKVKGIILGTFTDMDKNGCKPDIVELVKKYVDEEMPIVKTSLIGHGWDSKAIVIGARIEL